MLLPVYLGVLKRGEEALAASYRQVAEGHAAEADVYHTCLGLAKQCDAHVAKLEPIIERYGEARDEEPERLHAEAMSSTRGGPLGVIRDLQELYLVASLVDTSWTLVKQAALGLRDGDLVGVVGDCQKQTSVQLAWMMTKMKTAAPQALVVAS